MTKTYYKISGRWYGSKYAKLEGGFNKVWYLWNEYKCIWELLGYERDTYADMKYFTVITEKEAFIELL